MIYPQNKIPSPVINKYEMLDWNCPGPYKHCITSAEPRCSYAAYPLCLHPSQYCIDVGIGSLIVRLRLIYWKTCTFCMSHLFDGPADHYCCPKTQYWQQKMSKTKQKKQSNMIMIWQTSAVQTTSWLQCGPVSCSMSIKVLYILWFLKFKKCQIDVWHVWHKPLQFCIVNSIMFLLHNVITVTDVVTNVP